MNNSKILLVVLLATSVYADQSAVEVFQDIYGSCLREFRINCVKPKALEWVARVADKNAIRITEDLILTKKYSPEVEGKRGLQKDILEGFEDFLQSHDLIASAPAILRPDGPLGKYVPRTFQPTDITVPLATTGRSSKLVKKVIFPFLLGLKFKTAVLVPLALALIALKTWKALTLALLSLVLTGAISLFSKFVGPKVPAYEVVHYPHPVEHLDYHHVDVVPAPAIQVAHPVYAARQLDGQQMAYNSYVN
ncbi:hypothetical protein JTB14_009698 [Gonioctena quinquepunctata]|nr:hypothetical protein JTB14_009698 [Gonioctena quinquepunctata]